jgi:hypothetical protein
MPLESEPVRDNVDEHFVRQTRTVPVVRFRSRRKQEATISSRSGVGVWTAA